MADSPLRPGEVPLPFDPGARADAGVAFIGRVRSPWATRADCPKNLREARERGLPARIELDPAYAQGLSGLKPGDWVHLLLWFDEARRDLILLSPGHRDGPTGVFALRAPVRPNPVGLSLVRITAIDGSRIEVDAVDCRDGTPLLDIKPWIGTVDAPPGLPGAPR